MGHVEAPFFIKPAWCFKMDAWERMVSCLSYSGQPTVLKCAIAPSTCCSECLHYESNGELPPPPRPELTAEMRIETLLESVKPGARELSRLLLGPDLLCAIAALAISRYAEPRARFGIVIYGPFGPVSPGLDGPKDGLCLVQVAVQVSDWAERYLGYVDGPVAQWELLVNHLHAVQATTLKPWDYRSQGDQKSEATISLVMPILAEQLWQSALDAGPSAVALVHSILHPLA